MEEPSHAPLVAASAAEWPDEVAIALMRVVKGLAWQRSQRARLKLSDALVELEEIATSFRARPGLISAADDTPRARQCVVCMSAPRSVRFACGHCCCCDECTEMNRDHDSHSLSATFTHGGGHF
jgi:hypothetical protein